jgi:3'-5' exonuclease
MAPLGAQADAACVTMQPPLSAWFEASPNPEPASKSPTYSLSPSTSDDTPASASKPRLAPPSAKSAKRRAAEALLERKASKQKLDPIENMQSPPLRSFVVESCDRDCACPLRSNSINGEPTTTATASHHHHHHHHHHNSLPWCSLKITMPSLNWPAILTAIGTSKTNPSGEIPHQIPGGVAVHVVETHAALIPALAALRCSMQDGVVAIDLEWRPDYRPGSNNRVALMQLASGSTCVLIRCCLLNYSFPAALQHLFSDPSLTFVSFSWDSSDEMKMKSTFGVGKGCFARFLDLQQVANSLGYPSIGLAALTARVLGVTLPKSRSVSRSDWQRRKLTPAQVQYAALDALITGSVFRGLRLWHASPSPCTACKQPFGIEVRTFFSSFEKPFFYLLKVATTSMTVATTTTLYYLGSD